ncbi:hypothetical protein LCGC14_0223250 [marine sediment metagenome]|uniref:Uncharacterized protein n=1 Tax=marine sediment metagenome TaxID=412755 RepID=A0A0F9UTA8_9ZZZZ|nr:hypothetical protein [bacterium]
MFDIVGYKEQLAKAQAEHRRKVLAVGGSDLPFRKMMVELEKATVEKRLLIKARREPAFTFNHNEMVKICHLAYDGIIDNTYEYEDKFTEIGDEYNNLENIHKIFTPIGNAIIGHKVVKDYCGEYISDKKKRDLRNKYGDIKTKVAKVLDSEVIEAWATNIALLGREHGVFPETGKRQSVLYNIEKIGIRYPELASIAKEISLFKEKFPDKEPTNYKTMKTGVFKSFLKELNEVK